MRWHRKSRRSLAEISRTLSTFTSKMTVMDAHAKHAKSYST